MNEKLDGSSKATKRFQERLEAVQAVYARIIQRNNELDAKLKLLGKDNSLKQLMSGLPEGGQKSQLVNATLRGEINRFRALAQQQFAQLTNTYVKGLRDFTRAVGDRAILDMAREKQRVASADRGTLEQQIAAQRYRVADASMPPAFRQVTTKATGAAGQSALESEKRLLAELEASRERMLATEKAIRREQDAKINLQERINRLQDQEFRSLQNELQTRQAISQIERLRDPELRATDDALAKERARVASQRAITNYDDPEQRAAREELSVRRQLDRLAEKRLQNHVKFRNISGERAADDRLRVRIANRELKIEEELLRSGGQETAELVRQRQRLSELVALQERRAQASKEIRRDERIIAETARLRDPRSRELDDALARQRQVVSGERQLASYEDPELKTLKEKKRLRQELERLERRQVANRQRFEVTRPEDADERLRLRIQNRFLKYQEAMARSGGQVTAETELQLRRYQELTALAQRRRDLARDRVREERESARIEKLSLSESVSRERSLAGRFRKLDQMRDPDFRDVNQQISTEQRLNQISERRTRNFLKINELKGQENALARLQVRIDDRRLQYEEAFLRSKGQVTQEVLHQERRLHELLALQRRLTAESKERAMDERATSQALRDRKTAQNFANAGDRRFIDSQVAVSKAVNERRLFSDGGAFLFRIQAQLMGNYILMNKLFQLFSFGTQFVMQLDQAFAQLQAITATTRTEMAGLEQALIKVSEKTKFTAVEVAEAAVILGQAGMSTTQIKESIEAITLLATATGTDLNQAVDLVTSTINVFKLQASEAANVANVLTASVNNSKLTIDKLTLGLQYAGNIASSQGVAFQELTAVLGAMANSGIRAGSTLGTGLRQLLITFAAPTEEFKNKLRTLGISMDQVNVKTQGFAGVLRNLREGGFTAADALEVLEVRAGAAFNAVTNNLGTIDRLESIFSLTAAAEEANVIQMESLSNKMARAASVMGTFIKQLAGPFTSALKMVLDGGTSLLQMFSQMEGILNVLGTAVIAFGVAMTTVRLLTMIGHMQMFAGAAATFTGAMNAATAGMTRFGMSVAAAETVLKRFLPFLIVGVVTGLLSFAQSSQAAADSFDELQAQTDQAEGRLGKIDDALAAVTMETQRLVDRTESLKDEQSALTNVALQLTERFKDWGYTFDSVGGKIEDFVGTLGKLRGELLELRAVELQNAAGFQIREVSGAFRKASEIQVDPNIGFMGGSAGLRVLGALLSPNDWADTLQKGDAAKLAEIPGLQHVLNKVAAEVSSSIGVGGNLIAEGMDAGETRATLTNLKALQGELYQLTSAIEAGRGAFAEIPKALRVELLEAIDTQVGKPLQRKINYLSIAAGGQIQLDMLQEQSEATLFDRQAYGMVWAGRANKYEYELKTLESQAASATSEAELREILARAQQIAEDMEEAGVDAKAIALEISRISEGAYGQTETKASVDRLRGMVIKLVNDVTEQVEDLVEGKDKLRLETMRSQMSRLRSAATGNVSANQVRFYQEQYRQAFQVETEMRHRALEKELREKGLLGTDEGDAHLSEFLRAREAELANEMQGFENTLRKIDDAGKNASDALDRFSKRISQVMSDLQISKELNRGHYRTLQYQIDATELPGQRNLYSDVQREEMRRNLTGLETQAMEADALHVQRAMQRLEEIQGLIRQERVDREALQASAEASLSDPDNLSKSDKDRYTKQRADAQRDLNRLRDEEIGLTQKQRDLETQLLDINQQLRARRGELSEQPFDFMTSLETAFRQYQEESGAMMTQTARVANQMKGLFGDINNAFSGLVKGIVSGTDSIGKSFQKMAVSIIESMLDIAAQEVATGLFGFFKQALGFGVTAAAGGGGGIVHGGGYQGGSAMQGVYAHGGLIRAAMGRAIPTRDSVHVLARPGEYILRNSAVDAIGRENLDRINALGNRTISSSAPRIQMPQQKQGDGVVNVWVISPDQQPSLGPKDVVAVIGEDIARGGSIKKLVKSVQMGTV